MQWPWTRRRDVDQLRAEIATLRDALTAAQASGERRDVVGLLEAGFGNMVDAVNRLIEQSTKSAIEQRDAIGKLEREREEHRAKLREERALRARARQAQGRDANGRILPAPNGHQHFPVYSVQPRVD